MPITAMAHMITQVITNNIPILKTEFDELKNNIEEFKKQVNKLKRKNFKLSKNIKKKEYI